VRDGGYAEHGALGTDRDLDVTIVAGDSIVLDKSDLLSPEAAVNGDSFFQVFPP